MITIRLQGPKFSLKFGVSFAHFRSDLLPDHGPRVWPWWKLVAFSLVNLDMWKPSNGRRLWTYTRWGACYFDFIVDRRGLKR